MKIKKKIKKLTILMCILDIGAIGCLFLAYGPISFFRDLLVTTAMTTMEHQYLAKTLYSNKTIEKVLKNNVVKDNGNNSDSTHIVFNNEESGVYENEYEKAILKREDEDLYKVINISGTGYKGYLIAIYDPKRVKLATSIDAGYNSATLDVIAKQSKALVAINASGFEDEGGVGDGTIVSGILIKDGQILNNVSNTSHGGGIIGFNKDGILMLSHKSAYEAIKDGMIDGVQFGPFLIVNGEASTISGNGGMGIHPRTAIAQRKDGIVLFLIIDGRQPGYSIGSTIGDVKDILLKYGAYNAANLDGGASSTLAINGEIYNKPCGLLNGHFVARNLPNAWILE